MKYIFISFIFVINSSAVVAKPLSEALPAWKQPTPEFSQQYDWLLLSSGEWLKGDIISMYDDELEFESDEFDLLNFDWDKVTELRSRYDQSIRLSGGRVVQGFLIVQENKLKIISNGQLQEYSLSELLSISSSSENRRGLWDGSLNIGLDFLHGNVGQKDQSLIGVIQRRTPYSRLRTDIVYNYGTVQNKVEKTDYTRVNTLRFSSYFDVLFSRKVFFRAAEFEHFSDELQNIQFRNTLGLALGYHFVNNKRTSWDITLGPSYQETKYLDTGNDELEHSGVISIGTLLEYEFSSRIDFVFDYTQQFVNQASGKRLNTIRAGLSFDLENNIDIDVSFFLDRIAEPLIGIDNVVPEKNDYRLVFSVGYTFK
jgi:putative salt-induced outer membrane protein YdiY